MRLYCLNQSTDEDFVCKQQRTEMVPTHMTILSELAGLFIV